MGDFECFLAALKAEALLVEHADFQPTLAVETTAERARVEFACFNRSVIYRDDMTLDAWAAWQRRAKAEADFSFAGGVDPDAQE